MFKSKKKNKISKFLLELYFEYTICWIIQIVSMYILNNADKAEQRIIIAVVVVAEVVDYRQR